MTRRTLVASAVAVLLAASLAEAQRGWGRGGAGGVARLACRPGSPPTPTRTALPLLPADDTAVRAQQRGMGWGTDYPFADINFSTRLPR